MAGDTSTEKTAFAPSYRVIAQTIAQRILRGELKPGDPMPTEAALCEQFGVNRSTVREGTRLLEETGMLRRVNAKRLVVSKPTTTVVGEHLERALRLQGVTFFELWETAMVLEPKTASLAAIHLNGNDLEALRANIAATENALSDPSALAQLDVEFHALIARGVHNRVLLLTREPMARLFYPAFEAVLSRVPESSARLLKAHKQIYQALSAGDAVDASTWMEKHIRDFKVGFEIASLDFQSSSITPLSASWSE
jgi:DNA-binding FadR family transcriptional regulator